MLDLVCVGRILKEIIVTPQDVSGPFMGGPAAYCSVAAARMGARVGLVTTIGADLPEGFLRPLLEAGVDTSGIAMGSVSTQTELVYDVAGNKDIRYPTTSRPIRMADVPTLYRGASLVYLCSMDSDVPVDDVPEVATAAITSAADLGGYGGVHMSKEHRGQIPSLARLACDVASSVDIVKASAEDTACIFGWNDPLRAAKVLGETGCRIVLVTLGALGVLVWMEGKHVELPPAISRAVDATGAGDVFMAGFLCEYLRQSDPVSAAQWGCAVAAIAIERSGGVYADRMPTRDAVAARVRLSYQSPGGQQ